MRAQTVDELLSNNLSTDLSMPWFSVWNKFSTRIRNMVKPPIRLIRLAVDAPTSSNHYYSGGHISNAQGDTRRAKRAFPIALAIGTNMGLACKMTIGKYANVLRSQAHYRKN